MNNTTQTALATAVTAATEAAQMGQHNEARALLTIVAEQLPLGEGGKSAAAARRGKILRLQAETQMLLDAEPPVEPAPSKATRQAAPPQHLSPDAWSRVRAALVALGIDPAERDSVAAGQEQAAQLAAAQQDRYTVKVA